MFVAPGPANRLAVMDAKTAKIEPPCWWRSAGGRWHSPPDEKYPLTTDGLSHGISATDIAVLGVVRPIATGRMP